MKIDDISEWVELGDRLRKACPDKYDEILDALRETVGAQEVIAQYDWQLFMRGHRPKKIYEA
jgi:hypothetical protein